MPKPASQAEKDFAHVRSSYAAIYLRGVKELVSQVGFSLCSFSRRAETHGTTASCGIFGALRPPAAFRLRLISNHSSRLMPRLGSRISPVLY